METQGNEPSHDIFLSYSHVDKKFVDALADSLREVGYSLWTDTSALVGGHLWTREIQKGIDACKCVIVVVTRQSLASDYVNIEFHYALQRRQTTPCVILPILLQEIPSLPMELAIFHYITSFMSSYEQGFDDLLVALKTQKVQPESFKGIRFFGEDPTHLRELFGTSASTTIYDILHYMAGRFKPLFNLGDDLARHPLFEEIGAYMTQHIPEVSLKDEDGKLMRINVRHVLLRQETLRLLIEAVPADALELAGRRIGTSAASDLLKNTVENRYFPSSAVAFITLWSYWDRIGGMGIIKLIEPRDEAEHAYWDIEIDNNFLHVDETRHDVCQFWCGYIFGFVSTALNRIGDLTYLMSRDREDELSLVLPVFDRIKSVDHLATTSSEDDTFRVTFEPDQYAQTRRLLNEGRRHLLLGSDGLLSATRCCKDALRTALYVHGGNADAFVGGLTELSDEERTTVQQILGDVLPASRDEVAAWFEAIISVIRQLTRSA